MNRFVAPVPVDCIPTAAVLDDIGPYITIVPLVVELTVGVAAIPVLTLPEMINVPTDELPIVATALISLPKTLPVTVTMPELRLSIAGPPILVGPITFPSTLRFPPPFKYTVPPDVVLTPAITDPDTLIVPVEPCQIVLLVVPAIVTKPPSTLPVIDNEAAFCVIIAQKLFPLVIEMFPIILAEEEPETMIVGKNAALPTAPIIPRVSVVVKVIPLFK